MRSHIFMTAATAILSATLVYQVVPEVKSASPRNDPLPPNSLASIKVFENGVEKQLWQVSSGRCRYVIALKEDCIPGAGAIGRWKQSIDTGFALPPGWDLISVTSSDSKAVPTIAVGQSLVTPLGELRDRLGILSYPSHFVLDTAGKISKLDVGAEPIEPGRFQTDCTIAPRK